MIERGPDEIRPVQLLPKQGSHSLECFGVYVDACAAQKQLALGARACVFIHFKKALQTAKLDGNSQILAIPMTKTAPILIAAVTMFFWSLDHSSN